MKQRTRKVWPNTVEVALGDALEWGIQRWVVWTGRETRISEAPWLEGPIGERRIGPDFYEAYAREEALELVEGEPETGLLTDFSVLSGGGFEAEAVRPEIRRFYERTALFGLDVRPEWSGPLRYSARTLIYLVSRNIQQLNLPTSPVAAGAGMSSELIGLRNPITNQVPYCGWLRRSLATGAVITGKRTGDFAGYWGGDHHNGVPIFVPTHQAPAENPFEQVHYVTDGIAACVEQAKAAAGDRDVFMHGAYTAQQALKAGLVDEVDLQVSPVILGAGERLLDGFEPGEPELELVRVLEAPGTIHIRYRVVK
jgi:dihydrofolate reductase